MKKLRAAFPAGEIFLTLGPMLNDTWPDAEARALSCARDAITATLQALPADKRLHFLEYPDQARV